MFPHEEGLLDWFAGAVGAILRTVIGQFVKDESGFPIATFAVNIVGTFLLCFISGRCNK